jgi:hypothetical protein
MVQVMPYVSLCSQKAAYLEKLLQPLGRTVNPMYGGLGRTNITPGETGTHLQDSLTWPEFMETERR